MTDPRIFFAAERTLLAWIRSGLTVIGLGFVVARFGLFINVLGLQHTSPTAQIPQPVLSTWLGLGLILVGAFVIFAAAFQHVNFLKSLSPEQFPPQYRPALAPRCALALGTMGLLLAAYLLSGATA